MVGGWGVRAMGRWRSLARRPGGRAWGGGAQGRGIGRCYAGSASAMSPATHLASLSMPSMNTLKLAEPLASPVNHSHSSCARNLLILGAEAPRWKAWHAHQGCGSWLAGNASQTVVAKSFRQRNRISQVPGAPDRLFGASSCPVPWHLRRSRCLRAMQSLPSLSRTMTKRSPGLFQALSLRGMLRSKSFLPSWEIRTGPERGREQPIEQRLY